MRKFLPYILILIIAVGLFSPIVGVKHAEAVVCDGAGQPAGCEPGVCMNFNIPPGTGVRTAITFDNCHGAGLAWVASATATKEPSTPVGDSPFDREVGKNTCVLSSWATGSLEGCILQFVYWTFYTLGAWLLAVAASFFNFFIKITLGSELLKSDFVAKGWAVVRDLSNIFFILILLYIAIKIILGLGGHDTKKMIVGVIVIALLINFSMFMTHVVIDTSNILALIFYNKINTVNKKNPNAAESLIDYATGEKDLAGGLTQSFNPAYKLPPKFFTDAGIIKIPGKPPKTEPVSTGTLIGITVIAGAIMLFAAYALFISALSFLGRLIELFVLIILSPFAFLSSSVPHLSGLEYLGWKAWLHRLITVSFMAPIFMFFLYFIFLLIGEDGDMFKDSLKGIGTVHTLLSIMIPAGVILMLLLQATKFAKKGSGMVGEAIIKGGTMVAGIAGGVAIGAATGGAAMALRGTVGRGAANLAESNKFRDWAANTRGGQFISNRVTGLAGRTFDARNAPGAEGLAKGAGVNLAAAKAVGLGPKKGFAENRAAAVKKQEEFANKQLDTSDYGKAELSRGNMDRKKAFAIETKLMMGGMDASQAAAFRNQLMGSGIQSNDLSNVARHLNTTRRNTYADRLEKRDAGWSSGAGVRNARKRIAANKIRKDVATQARQANLAETVAALAKEIPSGGTSHATPTRTVAPTAPTPPPSAPPAAGPASH